MHARLKNEFTENEKYHNLMRKYLELCLPFKMDLADNLPRINPHLLSGPVHRYQLDESICHFRGVWCTFFIFILFRIDIPVNKQ